MPGMSGEGGPLLACMGLAYYRSVGPVHEVFEMRSILVLIAQVSKVLSINPGRHNTKHKAYPRLKGGSKRSLFLSCGIPLG